MLVYIQIEVCCSCSWTYSYLYTKAEKQSGEPPRRGKPLQFTGPVLCTSTSSSPLVEELRTFLETSVQVKSPEGLPIITIRLALACVASDIPATRKVCVVFLGHNTAPVCNKCMKRFLVAFGNSTDYSGCNREYWQPRTAELHRQQCEEIIRETTKTGSVG